MTENKLNCIRCNALFLESTSVKSGGFCLRCFMELNNGLKPNELNSIKERGLLDFFNKWNSFVKKGVPKIKKNRQILAKLNHYLPLINASISGHLRLGKGRFDGEQNSKFLLELKAGSEGELLMFLTEVEQFNSELINATET